MSALRFDWDPAKATLNLRKHGVSFGEARTVFEDEEALVTPDPDHSVGEERFVILGLSSALRVLVVIHCEREHGDVIRIISARKADRQERAAYVARRPQ
ncbi:MAG: BrnT family toxin [Gemmatimonadetes bacterium]|nr:BrnT family toxin [Gemmatimonadota bacterium]